MTDLEKSQQRVSIKWLQASFISLEWKCIKFYVEWCYLATNKFKTPFVYQSGFTYDQN